jgi:DNA adenine methylase
MAISYIGGKSRISKFIIPFIPKNIETYCEPFAGQFWVFFKMNLNEYSNLKTVVYNDFNNLNANLYRCVKYPDKLWDELSKYPCQELGVVDTPPIYGEIFRKCQKEVFDPNLIIGNNPNFDIACKYVYVLASVFSGSKPETSAFMDYKGKYRCKVLVFMDKLKNPEYRKHFEKINFVENVDFQDVIEKYDSLSTYYYNDPPYRFTENYYSNHIFEAETHERLANVLKKIKGKFALSYYEFPQLLEWFPKDQYHWEQKEFAKASAAAKDKKQTKGTELLIMNY